MPTNIDPLSGISLHTECFFDDTYLGDATGFLIKKEESFYFVTNWHVVSGRDPISRNVISPTAATPNKIKVWHHAQGNLGKWIQKTYNLLDADGGSLWKEKVLDNGEILDVVLLKVDKVNDVDFYELDLASANVDLLISPSEPVSIIGFPYGRASAGKFPIWKTGHVASDIDLNFDNKPIFLIDGTTKPGMSGSPVVAKRVGSYAVQGGIAMGGSRVKFMGIYSGRARDEDSLANSNLGLVWKPQVIDLILS